MNEQLIGPGGVFFVGCYLLSLLFIGFAGFKAKKEESLEDFYLGGRNMGFAVLFLTLYATQYSGNTLIGFSAKSYRMGFLFISSVTSMMAVVGAYLIYAPRLRKLSEKKKYITVGDFIQDRYQSVFLTVFVALICVFALSNYILSNLKAIGHIVEVTSGGMVSFGQGVIALSIIMVVYETLGGMRSVAWTDAIQGVLLFAGCVLIFSIIQYEYGGLSGVAESLRTTRQDLWEAPDSLQKRQWLSTLLIFFFGVSIYPHAIQRIYAAKDKKALKRSLQAMAFMPLFTTFFMVVVGIVGIFKFPGLGKMESEQITLLLLNDLSAHLPTLKITLILFISAALAAIMSTVDSALLAISSLFTKDFYSLLRPGSTQSHLTKAGKSASWAIMAVMAFLAIYLPQTIWRLIEIKLEILCQVAPAIFLGVHWKGLSAKAVTAGLGVGMVMTLVLMFGGFFTEKPWGIHAGIWGLMVNFMVVCLASCIVNWRQTKS